MALRCPECKSVDGFSVTFELEAEVNEHEHLKHRLDEDDLFTLFDTEDCTCSACGHTGFVLDFRRCHNDYMPDAKTAFRAIWTTMSDMNSLNDAVCEKDDSLGKSMRTTRHRLYDLLGQLEKMVKQYEYDTQRH